VGVGVMDGVRVVVGVLDGASVLVGDILGNCVWVSVCLGGIVAGGMNGSAWVTVWSGLSVGEPEQEIMRNEIITSQ